MPPRSWQPPCRKAVLEHQGPKGALVVVATGCGKTYLFNWIAVEDYVEQGRRVLVLAHRKSLVDQPGQSLIEHFPQAAHKFGVVRADRDQSEMPLVYASMQTLIRPGRSEHYLSFGYPDLLVVDEAHRSGAKAYRALIKRLTGPNTKVMGVTATADREDDADIDADWEVVYSYGIARAIKDRVLLPPYAAKWQLAGLKERLAAVTGRKDYVDAQAGAAMIKSGAVEQVVAAFKHGGLVATRLPFRDDSKVMNVGDRSTLVFTSSIDQAVLTAKALEAEGINARYVHSKMPEKEVERIIDLFRHGRIQVLVNAMMLTEGTDLPRASCIIIARPTKSWSLYVQMVGRVLRICGEQEDAFVIDMAGGVTDMHSLVAAPVLITTGCLESPDSMHRYYIPDKSVKGVCAHCEHEVPCGKRGGKHKYDNGICVSCGEPKCPESKDSEHVWIFWTESQNKCAECGLLIPNGQGGEPRQRRAPVVAAWKKLVCPGVVHACAAGPHGFVFKVAVDDEQWLPMWSPRGNRPRRLSEQPVSKLEADLVLSDILRKVEKASEMYGKKDSERAYQLSYTQAEKIARTWNLWRER